MLNNTVYCDFLQKEVLSVSDIWMKTKSVLLTLEVEAAQ